MKTTQEINVFDLSGLDMEKATLYHHDKDNITYIYIGADKYNIPENSLAVMKEGDMPLQEKMIGFSFRQDVKMDGVIAIFQVDEFYMVTFVTPNFTNINGEGAANDVIVLTLGNALKDLENV